MKRLVLSFLLVLSASAAFAQGGEMPEGELTSFEYTTTYHDGKFLSQCSSAILQADGKVRVTCYDYYDKFDSCTFYTDKQVLSDIRDVIQKEAQRHSMNKDVTYLNGETGLGQTHHFKAGFEGGGQLTMNGFIANYGMLTIQKYLRKVCETEVRNMPVEEIKGVADDNILWHAGGRFGSQRILLSRCPQGTKATRYLMQGREVLVLRRPKTGALIDVFVRLKDRRHVPEEIEQAYIDLLAGIYENEKGRSAFGSVTFSHDEIMKGGFSAGDPGSELSFEAYDDGDGIRFTDFFYWGRNRIIQRSDMPKDAPPGWGGHGAIAGPTKWSIHFSPNGLECEELETPEYCDTYPAFGKKFVLQKVRGPYEHTTDPWAVASEQPLVRDLLIKLSPVQLKAILAEMQARHADGSPLKPLEKLNAELIKTIL